MVDPQDVELSSDYERWTPIGSGDPISESGCSNGEKSTVRVLVTGTNRGADMLNRGLTQ